VTPVIALANQKGGVGKTSMTLGLSSALRRCGYRVLVLDVDQQANCTDVLLPPAADPSAESDTGPGIVGLMADPEIGGGVQLRDAIVPAGERWAGIDIVPGSGQLARVDADTANTQPYRLRKAFRNAGDTLEQYDVVLIDCPPSVGRTLVAALVACTGVLIITEPSTHSVQGVNRIMETMAEIRDFTDSDTPELVGLIINRVRRTTEHEFHTGQVRQAYGKLVFGPAIGDRIAVADATSRATPIHALSGGGAAAVAEMLDRLGSELVERLGLRVTDQMTAQRAAWADEARRNDERRARAATQPVAADLRDADDAVTV
jgi:chromosome partitioning protein